MALYVHDPGHACIGALLHGFYRWRAADWSDLGQLQELYLLFVEIVQICMSIFWPCIYIYSYYCLTSYFP